MISPVKKILGQRKLKKGLFAFWTEIEKNLELFYVMDQRQFITQGFLLCAWESVKGEDAVKKHEPILVYARAMERFNRLHKEHKEYEQWYAVDLKNKTPDNARKLHGLKQELDKQLKGMEALIIPAGQALETEMVTLGWLKNE